MNAQLAELETEGDEKRFDDAREEAAAKLAEVHARLSEMDAESGPARAATLLAGNNDSIFITLSTNWKPQVLDSMTMLKSNRRGRLVVVGGKS